MSVGLLSEAPPADAAAAADRGLMDGTATLADLLDRLASTRPERPAVTDKAGTATYRDLRVRSFDLAKALHADGVRRGDKVGILIGNRVEWMIACFAAQYIGATVVAINTWYTGRELRYVLDHAEVRSLFVTSRFLRSDYVATLEAMRPWDVSVPSLSRVVVLDGTPGPDMVGWDAFFALGDGVPDAEIAEMRRDIGSSDIAFLLYTSGSTAAPKGVMLAHSGLLRNCFDIGERQHLTEDDVLFLPISLFWGFGCSNGMMAALTHATHIVLQEHFDAAEAIALIERFGCTALYGTPNILQAIMDVPDFSRRDLSRLRKGLTIGTAQQMRDVIERFAPEMCQVFGFTEGYGNSTVADITDPIETRIHTTGRVLPGSELRIVDPETETVLPPGREGEIRVRGFIMAGYFKDPAATARATDADGFFRTGDIGVLDASGFLQFRGRFKEIIKTGGMNVSPAEVEEVLRAHPSVADAFVVGLPDPSRDEIVAALIVLVPGSTLSIEAVTRHCQAALSAFKVPRRIQAVAIDALPLTSTRKVHRARLPELFD